MEIVLISPFCTNRRIAKCSHTLSMLRFRSLASHKNHLIISNFIVLKIKILSLLTAHYSLLTIYAGVPACTPPATALCCYVCSIVSF